MNAHGEWGQMKEFVFEYLRDLPDSLITEVKVEREMLEDGEDKNGCRKYRPGLMTKLVLTIGG